MKPAKKVILITGATAGIGRAAAIAFAEEGHHVIATGRRIHALESLAQQTAGLDVTTMVLDVTDKRAIENTQKEVERLTDGRGIDVLINNAGFGLAGPLDTLTDEDLRAQYETNVFGLMAMTRAFVPEMRARREGRIINIGSLGGKMTMPFLASYNSTKYAVESLSDGLRIELRAFGIQVSLIEPGPIKTEFSDRAMVTVGKYRSPDSPYARVFDRAEALQTFSDGMAGSPRSVVRAIRHAATAKCARARYVVPFRGRIVLALVNWVPTPVMDAFWRIGIGLTKRGLGLRPKALSPSRSGL